MATEKPGAKSGRPKKPKEDHRQTITIRLPPDLMSQVQQLSRNVKGKFIEAAIREKFNTER